MSSALLTVLTLVGLAALVALLTLAARRGFERWCRVNELTPSAEDWDLRGLSARNGREFGEGPRSSTVYELDLLHTGYRRGLPVLVAREAIGRGDDRHHYYVAAMRCAVREPFAYAGDDFLAKGAIPAPARETLRSLVDGKAATAVFSDGRAIVVRCRQLRDLAACADGLAGAVTAVESGRGPAR